jgi:type IV secretory pathway VirB4 component
MRVHQPAHVITTAHLGSAYPFQAEGGLGALGPFIGMDVYGGGFCFGPFEMYAADVISTPNMVEFGQLGTGKSATMKFLAGRLHIFGYQSWISDPKMAADGSDESEYCPLARALGGRILTLYPGGPVSLNPLDVGGDGEEEIFSSRMEISVAILEAALNRTLHPVEGSALTEAIRKISRGEVPPTLRDLMMAMLWPAPEAASACAMTVERLQEESRGVAHALRRLVEGDLRGMLDGKTNLPVAELAAAPMVVFDLHRVYHSAALEVIVACIASWFRRVLREAHGRRFFFIQDEGWVALRRLSIARFFAERWKMARGEGVSYAMVIHRRTDMLAAGSEHDENVRIALGLLSDAETRVIFRQAPDEMNELASALHLNDAEKEIVPRLENHMALWKLGRHSYVVHHRLSKWDEPLVATDQAMR